MPCGLAHLMLRQADGTWRRAPNKMTAEDVEAVLNGNPDRYWISLKDPNTQAFATLAPMPGTSPRSRRSRSACAGRGNSSERLGPGAPPWAVVIREGSGTGRRGPGPQLRPRLRSRPPTTCGSP